MHLLVDGWNAIHANLKLKNILEEHSQEAAVKALSDIVSAIHDCENCRTTIVFDGKGDSIEIIRRSQIQTFSEVYTPTDMTADDFIEQYCAQHPKDCTVATADNLLDLTASFFGANIISPTSLFNWAKQCSQQIRNKTSQNKKENSITWKDTNPFIKLKAMQAPKAPSKEVKAKANENASAKDEDINKRKNLNANSLKSQEKQRGSSISQEKTKTSLSKKNSLLKKTFPFKTDSSSLSWKSSINELELSKSASSKGKTWADTNPFLALNIKKSKDKAKKSAKK